MKNTHTDLLILSHSTEAANLKLPGALCPSAYTRLLLQTLLLQCCSPLVQGNHCQQECTNLERMEAAQTPDLPLIRAEAATPNSLICPCTHSGGSNDSSRQKPPSQEHVSLAHLGGVGPGQWCGINLSKNDPVSSQGIHTGKNETSTEVASSP